MSEDLDELAFRFFKLFAQYECSLKLKGYYFPDSSRNVKVDWDRFSSQEIGSRFMEELGPLSEEVTYILSDPPMRQTVNNDGKIVWSKVANSDQSVQALFGHLRRIRNNLFHGAKFNDTWDDPERSRKLLSCGLKILEHYRERVRGGG